MTSPSTPNSSSLDVEEKISLESALFKITESAVNCKSISEYAERLHKIIQQLTYADNFFVVLYNGEKHKLNFVYVSDKFDSEINCEYLNRLTEDQARRTLTGYMLRTGRMQHLSFNDICMLEERNIVDSVGSQSHDWLGVPLIFDNQILGGMVIQSYQDDITYGQPEEEIMQFIARQIAMVTKSKQAELALIDSNLELENRVKERTEALSIANEALKAEIQERRKSQQVQAALFQITELVSTSESLQGLFFGVHKVIDQLMFAKNEFIALLSEDDQYINFVYFVDQFDSEPPARRYTPNSQPAGLTEQVLDSGESFLYFRGQSGPQEIAGKRASESWLGVPLKDKNKVFGVLAIQSYDKERVYTRDDQLILMTIGQQVATAILRKKDADSLKDAHETLERRVKERTHELEKTIERRKVVEEQLAYESLHDSLTGLPNRLQLTGALSRTLKEGRRQQDGVLALLFLDLDRFKIINDSLGHHIGDLFLVEVSKRLQSCVRSDDLVARLGGDEFCILMPSISKSSVALALCARILKELKKPLEVEGHSLITSASIGIRLANNAEDSPELVMSDADAAMYQAKHQGKNQFCLFDANIKELVTTRMKMERDLRIAVETRALYLVYQPVVNVISEETVGFEALIRWKHPEQGFISPEIFISIAEETGLIVDIGEQVIEMACRKIAELKAKVGKRRIYVNVNVSAVQILSRTLDDVIRRKLSQYEIEPENLNVEITESILIEDYKAALNFVRELKSMGIKVYLDDFGTGYSSLSYLHHFPFDAIKLDRSFIKDLSTNRSNKAIVEAIATLSSNLGIEAVAEGVEEEEQLIALRNMGYPTAQGFYFSKPVEADKIFALLQV
ncbi:EAL domain-containing protein [Aliikangiella sp. G2MR2-5]|uniref:bifunctional diguanylate cyclase/phosphodiesterase n=1 Tax=Aliikangiella sp. G2MR2-5 TaxID=2788943 RepID=UPI0018ABD187|nr:EAL domain-containing protein [Aliikangiella sp. G2MR2-5]